MWCLGKEPIQNQICWAIIFLRKKLPVGHRNLPVKWRRALAPGHRAPRFPGHQWHHWSHQDQLTSGSPQLGWLYLGFPWVESLGGGMGEGWAVKSKNKPTFWSDHHAHVFFSFFFSLNDELCIIYRYVIYIYILIYAYIHCFHSIKMVNKNWNRVGTNCSRKAWNCLSQVFVRHVLWRNLVNRVRWGLGGASHCNTTVS